MSLRTRLVLGVIVLAAIGLVAADVATYSSLRSFLLDRVDSTLNQVHPGVENAVFGHEPDRGPEDATVPNDCVEIRGLSGVVYRRWNCARPFLGAKAASPPDVPKSISLPVRANTREGDHVRFLTVSSQDGSTRFRVRASIEGDFPHYVLLIAAPLSSEDNTLHRLLVIELLVTAAVLAALVALSLWIVRLGLRPLREIERTATAITAGDLSHRVEVDNERTEVGRVGHAINEMLGRIEASDVRLRRFVADASHELRTPLAAVRAYAELFSRGAQSRPEDLARSMSGITREAERMSVLVEDLLLLARLDEGRPLERDRVQLDVLVHEAVDAARALDPERPLELDAKPVVVLGDRDGLRQIVDNLLSNVRSHTPSGSPARVVVAREGQSAVIEVSDSGPGLTRDELDRIFERFYRADASRSRASGGVGLGLSIVAAVARAHGGTVSARSDGGGATFRIELPAAPLS
ncbi:MAG TPA: HAMP domain-containing sensor histidine kinase [Gaiellaceae bacterium]|jgi:two-component system OmpR family sensor kinase